MKIFHVSDTHLGYSAFAKLDPERGLNQREADFYDSFQRFVEIAVSERPDMVLHSGDLFDSVRPSNRAISFALSEIKKLTDADIKFVAISGNHETPRLKETGSVFSILNKLSDCNFIYEGGLERIDLDGIEILAIPHSTTEQFQESMKEIRGMKKEMPRIVMLHAGILGVGMFRMNEVNELLLDAIDIAPEADYVAMGHYHNHVSVTGNCHYAGSTERSSIAEAGVEKGFVSLDSESWKKKFIPLKTRRMIDAEPLDLKGKGATEATTAIVRRLDSADFENAIARLKVSGLSNEARKGVDFNRIRKVAQKALSFDIRFEEQQEDEAVQTGSARIGGLSEEFVSYLENMDAGRLDKKRLEMMAQELFSESEE
jgi:DNA repair exonuclease SbcCD nuclease subunit